MVVMKRIKKILYYPTLIIIFVLGLYSISNTIINNYYLEEYNMINEDIILVEKNDSIYIPDDVTTVSNNNTNTTSNKVPKTIADYRIVYNNNDIVGRLSIPNTKLSVLLVQTTNNKYYLNHLINREYNKLGSTFVDYRTNLDTNKKINIYGHNNGKYSISFNILMNYLDKTYYEQHKLIEIETVSTSETYEIFSIQVTSNNNHMQVSFTDLEWYLYKEELINTSIYNIDTSIDDVTKMITLQTCTNVNDNEFLLIHGRKIAN